MNEMKERKAPFLSLYSESLLKLSLAEGQASLYLEGLATLAAGPAFRRYIGRLKADTDDHLAILAQLLLSADQRVFACGERLEREVAQAISVHIDAINLSGTPEMGLATAAIKLQDYVLSEYQRAADLAKLLGVNYDLARLEKMCLAKRLRRFALVEWQLEQRAFLRDGRSFATAI